MKHQERGCGATLTDVRMEGATHGGKRSVERDGQEDCGVPPKWNEATGVSEFRGNYICVQSVSQPLQFRGTKVLSLYH